MNIYIPKFQDGQVGGGWTFMRNFIKGMKARGHQFTYDWQNSDIVFVPGVTLVERDVIESAAGAGKTIIFRVDNVPRKSRNRRSRVYDNMRRYAELSDVVVYQSEWAKHYCMPISGDGEVVYNGVDQSIFYPDVSKRPDHPRVLFAYHGKNEQKNFWEAHLR